jgi:hypothetical protein
MSILGRLQNQRDWFPFPHEGIRPEIIRWMLLEGDRYAVTGALLTFVYVSLMVIGTLWTFEMQRILTETPAVQSILNTLLSGIILLVSIVVSINSIVLSHDITSVGTQEERIESVMEFRREVGMLTDSGESPTDPASFLRLMGDVVHERAQALADVPAGTDESLAGSIREYAQSIESSFKGLDDSFQDASSAEFGVLWMGIEMDHGPHIDRTQTLKNTHQDRIPEDVEERLDDLVKALELFTVGKEYFKTLYYNREISDLSRTLLTIALPIILVNNSAVLAINAQLLPSVWIFGLPPLLSFVAVVFTVSLAPFIVLTAYMLRLATVARRSTTAGPFSPE